MKAHLLALATILVWGTTFVSTKVLLADLAPQWILLIRFALGLAALCALRPRMLSVASRRDEGLFALAGLTGVAAYYLLENMALTFASATAVGVIVTTSPLITALIAAARGQRETLSPRFLAGFALAMAGVLLVSLAGSASEGAVAGAGAARPQGTRRRRRARHQPAAPPSTEVAEGKTPNAGPARDDAPVIIRSSALMRTRRRSGTRCGTRRRESRSGEGLRRRARPEAR